MKKVIKIFSIFILTFILLMNTKAVTITTNSTAGTVDTNSRLVTNTGTLSVTNINSNDNFYYYKIIDTFYNSTTNNITYEFTSTFKTFLQNASGTITVSGSTKNISALTVADYQALTSGDTTNGSTQTASTLDILLSKYASYIKTNNISGTTMTKSGTTASATVAAGSYLVLSQGISVYAVMANNVAFTGDGSTWTLNNATIVAKRSEANVSKSVNVNSGSTSIGTPFTYTVTLTIPAYPTNATNTSLSFEDTMDAGITFNGFSNLTVSDGNTALTVNSSTGNVTNGVNTVATTTFSNNKLTMTFNYANLTNNTVTITYQAQLNNNAVLGSTGNKNNIKFIYSNNPYGSGTNYNTSTTTVRTYGIKVLKKNSSDTPLPNAQIRLCSTSTCTNVIGTATTDSNGYATFTGVANTTYYYQEVKAPTGYRLDSTIYSVNVGTPSGGYKEVNLVNQPLGLLPATGGTGTYIYTVVGALMMISAAVLLFKRKKQSNEI